MIGKKDCVVFGKRLLVVALFACLIVMMPRIGAAQRLPRNITIIVAHAPGGGADVWTRHLVPFFERSLPGHHNVVVENIVGSRGLRAMNRVLHARPNGSTLGVSLLPGAALLQALHRNPYNLAKINWVGTFATASGGIIVKGNSPYKSLADLQKASSKHALKMAVSNLNTPFGAGSIIAANELGIKTTFVPQTGTAAVNLAVIRGDCDYGLTTYIAAQQAYKSGDVRYLWVYEPKRVGFLPEVKTIGELGHADLLKLFLTTYDIYTAQRVPRKTVRELTRALKKAVSNPEFVRKLKEGLGTAEFQSPAEVRASVSKAISLYTASEQLLKRYVR